MCAYLSNDSKSAPSSKWCRKAFRNLSEYIPLQYRDLNILRAAEALLGSLTRLNKSSSLHPHTIIDSLGSCLAVKNCSWVTSVGNMSPNLTSNLSRICLTVTSDPMANTTSAALPRRERRTFVITTASEYTPVFNTLSTSLFHCGQDASFLWPSPEKKANLGGAREENPGAGGADDWDTGGLFWYWLGLWKQPEPTGDGNSVWDTAVGR